MGHFSPTHPIGLCTEKSFEFLHQILAVIPFSKPDDEKKTKQCRIFGLIMIMQLNNILVKNWAPETLRANKPDSMFCSCMWRVAAETPWYQDYGDSRNGAHHSSESPCDPRSTGTTLDVILPILFNLTWHLRPWKGLGKNMIVEANLALVQVLHTSLALRVCVWVGTGLFFSWLWFKEMNVKPKPTEWWVWVTEGPFACCWGIPLAVLALGNRLEAHWRFSTHGLPGYWVPGNSGF